VDQDTFIQGLKAGGTAIERGQGLASELSEEEVGQGAPGQQGKWLADFRKASKGMKMTRVHHIFDTRGRRVDYVPGGNGFPAEQVRVYRPCNPNVMQINASYRKRSGGVWRLAGKNWFS
jgi:hypothetical protein